MALACKADASPLKPCLLDTVKAIALVRSEDMTRSKVQGKASLPLREAVREGTLYPVSCGIRELQ